MNYESCAIIIKQVDDPDHAPTGPPPFDHQLFVSCLAGKTATGVAND